MTGAGRSLKDASHAGFVLENLSAYKVGSHQHQPEIEQALGFPVSFVPASSPDPQGPHRDVLCPRASPPVMRAACSTPPTQPRPPSSVLPEGVTPELSRVQGTDAAEVAVFGDRATDHTIVICAIDNLGKGAAGQAVQNANLALGYRRRRPVSDSPESRSEVGAVSVTAPQGFVASGIHAGIRRSAKDLAVLRSVPPAVGAAMFSRNKVQAACLLVNRDHISRAEPQAVVVNSGVANSATGERGRLDALATAAEAARLLDLKAEEVLVLSTGLIGVRLPLHKLLAGLQEAIPALISGRR